MRYALVVPMLAACACTPRGENVTPQMSDAARAYDSTCKNDLAAARQALSALEARRGAADQASVLMPLNELQLILDRASNSAQLYRNVHPDAAVRDLAEHCEQEIDKISTDLSLSRPIYDAVSAVDTSHDNAVTQRHVRHLSRDFKRAGVDKDQASRDRIRALKEELIKIGQEFAKNVRDDVRKIAIDPAELAGLPADYIEAHKPGADGKVTITTDYPDYNPFVSYAKSDARRLDLYREFRKRGHPRNQDVLSALLSKRYELAQLLGYKTWAAYVTEDKMVKTADNVQSFISKVAQGARPRAQRDYDELLAQLHKENPAARQVGDWQKAYLEEQVKKAKYDFDAQALRQYFPYEKVRQGVLDLTARMFGLSYRKVDVPVWHESVLAYEMWSGDTRIGTFYLDMHPREGKYKHAAAFPMRAGIAGRQLPEAALVCNFPGGDGTAGLMEHHDVETFLHEFGHLLHHMLGGKQAWVPVTGLNTEWDFVEAPSQMLEEWSFDSEALNSFARNDKDEPIPAPMIAQLRRARDFGKGTWVRHQMFYAAVSLAYYDRNPNGLDTTTLMKELQTKYSPFPYVDDTYFQLSFGHLDGYSAIYCTYMWSLVIAKDMFSWFEKRGLLNLEVARRYREKILEPGGSQDAELLVRDFLGRPYSFDSFSTWLNRT